MKANLSSVLRRVGEGERVRITRRGRYVADLLPPRNRPAEMQMRKLIAEGRVTPRQVRFPRTHRRHGKPEVGFGRHSRRTRRRSLSLYLDASALVKRYVDEDGSDAVVDAMNGEDTWTMCRIGFVETIRRRRSRGRVRGRREGEARLDGRMRCRRARSGPWPSTPRSSPLRPDLRAFDAPPPGRGPQLPSTT